MKILEMVKLNSRLGLGKQMRLAKVEVTIAKLALVLKVRPVQVVFSESLPVGVNCIFSPGGVDGAIMGLPWTPLILMDARFLEKDYFSQAAGLLAHEMRHWWQYCNHREAYMDFSSSQTIAEHAPKYAEFSDHFTWKECDARNWSWWYGMDKKTRGEYPSVRTDAELAEWSTDSIQLFRCLVEQRYAQVPIQYIEWFGAQPTVTIF